MSVLRGTGQYHKWDEKLTACLTQNDAIVMKMDDERVISVAVDAHIIDIYTNLTVLL